MNEVEEDDVTVFSKQEVIRLAMFHIRNISFGVKDEEKEQEQNAKSNANAKSARGRKKA